MKKVLIITYYWPPSGGSGVQRWLQMSKYLPENGWQPVVYTAENAEYPVEDLSLEKDVAPETVVIRQPVREPYNLYKRFIGIKKESRIKAGFLSDTKKPSLKENVARWIRGNFFIPDARCGWIKPSVKYLTKYLSDNHIDVVVSTGPPHSMHLIALELHEKTGIPWVADFRDPWTEIDFYDDLKLTRRADCKHHRLEQQVLTKADRVVSVGWGMASSFEKIRGKAVDIIPNGYDSEGKKFPQRYALTEKFTITHIGIITPSRNMETLWRALSDLTETDKSFSEKLSIRLIGSVDNSVRTSLKRFNLLPFTTLIKDMPHDDVIAEQCSSRVLLLLINRTLHSRNILTGKLYEYLYAGRPIMAIGPEDGDAARVINDCNAGVVADYDNLEKIKSEIMKLFMMYKENKPFVTDRVSIERYSRKNQTKDYVSILNKITAL